MGRICSVAICSKSTSDGVTLHRVPNTEIRGKWLDFIRVSNLPCTFKETKFMYVCSDHFETRFVKVGYAGGCSITKHGFPTMLNSRETSKTLTSDESSQFITIDEESEVGLYEKNCAATANLQKQEDIIRKLQAELLSKNKEIMELREKLKDYQNALRVEKQFSKRLECRKRREPTSEEKIAKRKKCEIPDSVPAHAPIVMKELVKRYDVGRTAAFSDPIKEFAFAMHYYSPRCYNYTRAEIKVLPSERMFAYWTQHIDAKPGLLKLSLDYIKNEVTTSAHKLYYALTIDEIHIREQLMHLGDGFTGFEDFGNLMQVENEGKAAKTALFVMATGINGSKKIPIAYALTNGLKANVLTRVITRVLEAMSEVKARVISLTFDGLPSNLKAVEALGAQLDVFKENFQPHFPHPTTKEKIYVILDPSHMFKLLRNVLHDYGVLVDKNGNDVSWAYIASLQKLQENCGLKAANKLSIRHTNYQNQKMKTRLCVQVFSNSVSVAIGVCRELKIYGFEHSEATEKFLSLFDKLFDVLNSKSTGKGQNEPLRKSNHEHNTKFFADCKEYLKGLSRKDGTLMMKTPKYTGFRGLYVTITSIESIFEEFVLNEDEDLQYLPCYKFSQDHLESFFSVVRGRGGFNNNPNVRQIQGAVRDILCMRTNGINTGNCIDQEEHSTKISPLARLCTITDDSGNHIYEETEQLDIFPENLTPFIKNVVFYIAGFVVRKLSGKLKCPTCIAKLVSDEDAEMLERNPDYVLLRSRQMGGLIVPSESVVRICKLTELQIRKFTPKGLINMDKTRITKTVLDGIIETGDVFNCERGENLDHSSELICEIATTYITVRFHHLAKESTLALNPSTKRSVCTKTVLFNNQ